MNKITSEIKLKRFEEINSRLNLLHSSGIKEYFLKNGFFPESQFLPSDYFSSKQLEIDYSDQNFNSKIASVFFPKSRFAFRNITIPPIKEYLELSNFIVDNWSNFKKHLLLSDDINIIPYSFPLFYEGKKRSEIGINNYKIMTEHDFTRIKDFYDYCVFVDIKDFYPSIYTHALAWSLDKKTDHSLKCDVCLCECDNIKCTCFHKCKKYWPNEFDEKIRHLYSNRTKGILIGPYTSDFASEVLLKTIDSDFSEKLKNESSDYIGLRFKDDYIFLAKNKNLAEKILSEFQIILNGYHLNINENKTKIEETALLLDKKNWKSDIEQIKFKISDLYQDSIDKDVSIKEKDFRLIIRKTQELYSIYGDEYIVKTVLGSFVKDKILKIKISQTINTVHPYNIDLPEVYGSILALLAVLCHNVPSSWPSFFAILSMFNNSETEEYIKSYLEILTSEFIEKDNTFGLLWLLHCYWHCDFEISDKNKDLIKEKYKENWLILSLLDPEHGKFINDNFEFISFIIEDGKKPYSELISLFNYSGI